MYIAGIDIAKKTHIGGITDDKGNHIGKSFKINNSVEGFENLLKKLAEIKLISPSSCSVWKPQTITGSISIPGFVTETSRFMS